MRIVLVCMSLIAASMASADVLPPKPQPAAAPVNCPAPEYRQFDFMAGAWVAGPSNANRRDDRSRWDKLANNCGLIENWTNQGGNKGYSLNYFDMADRKWHQHWIGADGDAVHFIGEWTGTMMAFKADDIATPGGGRQVLSMTFEPLPDGSVRQTGKISTDGGKTFALSYQLLYERQK
jgi:hypothetical protein